jgi:hypothetical protein
MASREHPMEDILGDGNQTQLELLEQGETPRRNYLLWEITGVDSSNHKGWCAEEHR